MRSMRNPERPTEFEYDFRIPPSDEEREQLMGPDFWDWDTPVDAIRTENPGLRLTIRFERDDVKAIGAAARRTNMPMDAFIKWAALVIAEATERVPTPSR